MSQAVRCPVCYGRGELADMGGCSTGTKPCYGCNGSGWVEVAE